MTAPGVAGGGVRRTALRAVLAAAAALVLLWLGARVHLQRACMVQDTPYLPICDGSPPPARMDLAGIRALVQRNPGDGGAWARLLVLESGGRLPAVLAAAATVAPNHAAVLYRRAGHALEQGRLQDGVDLLVQLVRYRNSGEAAQVLASIVASDAALPLLRPHLPHSKQWLPPVLAHLPALKVAPGVALPLVAEALEHQGLPEDARRLYMRSLKGAGQWLDAYGLWLAHHKEIVPLLYNGSFDNAFVPDGFDWELAPVNRSRAGVLVEQPAVARRGHVLELEFTGRSFTAPIVHQTVFAPPGRYRLRGDYRGAKLRSEGGLAWTVRCTVGQKAVLARSAPLHDSGGLWKAFEVVFDVPDSCGPVATLQLAPGADYEAAAGIKGRIAFDNFTLVRTPG